ncbi:MAG: hypothetical protein R3C20_16720 [Planctomycetaceae bacterium]
MTTNNFWNRVLRTAQKRWSTATVFMGLICLVGVTASSSIRPSTTIDDDAEGRFNQVCIVDDERINEASGLACSIRDPALLWMHNDSGDLPRLFCVDQTGKTRAVVTLAGVNPFDWEDMCSFEWQGESWLLVADFGDNARKRGAGNVAGTNPVCQLLLIPEPQIPTLVDQVAELTVKPTAVVDFIWEDGAHNCESIGVDTSSGQVLMVLKSLPHKCGLYSFDLSTLMPRNHSSEAKPTGLVTARRVVGFGVPFATGMDVSADNRYMAVVTPLTGFLIHRQLDESWVDALQRPPTSLILPPRKQGETVCFSRDGKFLLLNSELEQQPLWRMQIVADKN